MSQNRKQRLNIEIDEEDFFAMQKFEQGFKSAVFRGIVKDVVRLLQTENGMRVLMAVATGDIHIEELVAAVRQAEEEESDV